MLRGYLYRGKNLGTPKAPVAVLKNWAFATPRESHRGIHDVRFLQKKMGVNRGTHVPGPIYKLPSQAIRRRSGMAPGMPMSARCGYGGMWGEVGGDFVLWSLAPPGVRAATHGTRRRRERQLTYRLLSPASANFLSFLGTQKAGASKQKEPRGSHKIDLRFEDKRPEGGSGKENVTSRSSKANNTSGPPGPHKAGSGRRQGSYAPGPLARPPGDTVAGSTASASRASRSWLRAVAACMPCGLACSLHAAVGRTSIGTVLPDIRDGRGNRDRTALIPSVAWTSLVTNVVMTGLP